VEKYKLWWYIILRVIRQFVMSHDLKSWRNVLENRLRQRNRDFMLMPEPLLQVRTCAGLCVLFAACLPCRPGSWDRSFEQYVVALLPFHYLGLPLSTSLFTNNPNFSRLFWSASRKTFVIIYSSPSTLTSGIALQDL